MPYESYLRPTFSLKQDGHLKLFLCGACLPVLDFILNCYKEAILTISPQEGPFVNEDYQTKKYDYKPEFQNETSSFAKHFGERPMSQDSTIDYNNKIESYEKTNFIYAHIP